MTRIQGGEHRVVTTDGRELHVDRQLSVTEADELVGVCDRAGVDLDEVFAVRMIDGCAVVERLRIVDGELVVDDVRVPAG